jgi:steroid delta-isomerase-like uncharacterized protein
MSDAETLRRIPLEIFNDGRMELIDEFFAPDYIEHVAPPPGVPSGIDGLRVLVAALRTAFPDLRYEVVQQLQDGDTHVGHVRVTGTMSGDFAGMPATGKAATWEEIHIAKFHNGKLAEHWAAQDRLGMLQQLGLAPVPGV